MFYNCMLIGSLDEKHLGKCIDTGPSVSGDHGEDGH